MQLKPKFERKVINLGDLKFDESNPNKMNGTQVKALNKSIERYGYIQTIVADKESLVIADGEHRARELINKGIQEAEIILYPFKDEADRRTFRQVANKLHGEHQPDLDADEYKAILEKLDMEEFSNLTSISEQEILNTLNREEDELKENITEVEQIGNLLIECPKCKFKFKKKKETSI